MRLVSKRFIPWSLPVLVGLVALPMAAFAADPSCTITGAMTLPPGSTFHLCATGSPAEGNTYSWYEGTSQTAFSHDQCVDIPGLGLGTHDYVMVMSLNAPTGPFVKCPFTLTIEEGPPPPPELVCVTPPTIQCGNTEPIQLCAPLSNQGAGFTYTWSGDGITGEVHTACVTLAPLAPGDYVVHYVVSFDAPTGPFLKCDVPIHIPTCVTNCPRTVGFWSQQCIQRGNGSTKYTVAQVTAIAQFVDSHSDALDFGSSAFDGFCAVINPTTPMTLLKQSERQLAGLLANVAAGSLGFTTSNGETVNLDVNTPFTCGDLNVNTIGEFISRADSIIAFVAGGGTSSELGSVESCLDNINNGIGIGPVCGGDDDKSIGIGALSQTAPEQLAITPNPFRGSTTMALSLTSSKPVVLGVYDVAGRLVHSITSGTLTAGAHSFAWDGTDMSGARVKTGVYFVRGTIGGAATGMRLVVIR
jgi:flagellar hook capping protein FlgD